MANNLRHASLRWAGRGLVFEGGAPGADPIRMDGDTTEGPSPMELLLLSLAGCMAIDMRMILEKSRVEVNALDVEIEGERATDDPKRFVRVHMAFELEGPSDDDANRIARAIQLSADKYCSVHHTLDPALEVTTEWSLR